MNCALISSKGLLVGLLQKLGNVARNGFGAVLQLVDKV